MQLNSSLYLVSECTWLHDKTAQPAQHWSESKDCLLRSDRPKIEKALTWMEIEEICNRLSCAYVVSTVENPRDPIGSVFIIDAECVAEQLIVGVHSSYNWWVRQNRSSTNSTYQLLLGWWAQILESNQRSRYWRHWSQQHPNKFRTAQAIRTRIWYHSIQFQTFNLAAVWKTNKPL